MTEADYCPLSGSTPAAPMPVRVRVRKGDEYDAVTLLIPPEVRAECAERGYVFTRREVGG